MTTARSDEGVIEVRHIASILVDMLDDYIVASPFAAANPDVKQAAEKQLEGMCDLYQLIGQKHR